LGLIFTLELFLNDKFILLTERNIGLIYQNPTCKIRIKIKDQTTVEEEWPKVNPSPLNSPEPGRRNKGPVPALSIQLLAKEG